MGKLEQIQAKARELARSGIFMVGLHWSSSCASKTDIQKRANGFIDRPLEMSLIACVRRRGNGGRPLRHKCGISGPRG